jgi:Ribosomal protein S1
VRTLRSFGALVTLTDGARGIIRNRELSWEYEPLHPQELLSIGQRIKVMVLAGDPEGHRLNLSLRQALRDPWEGIDRKYGVGKVVRGKVVGLWHTGAFVELEPAIDGFIPLYEVSDSPPEKIEQGLWIGDTVEAVITRLDDEERHVRLSIRQHLTNLKRQRESVAQQEYLNNDDKGRTALAELLDDQSRIALLSFFSEPAGADPGNGLAAQTSLVEHFPQILIADNDRGFRSSLQRLLIRLGHQVETVDSAEKAVARCSENRFDLLLIDFSFRTDMMNGLEAAKQILQVQADLPIIIITGLSLIETYRALMQDARALGVRSLLFKPMEIGSLYHRMEAIVSHQDDWETLAAPDPFAEATNQAGQKDVLMIASKKLIELVCHELADLQNSTDAKACVLFQLGSITNDVRVFAHTGSHLTGYDALKYNLQASPVVDVIQQREQVFENNVSRKPQAYQNLRILDFASCIGVPVGSFGHTGYGLFLFHGEKGHFIRAHLNRAATTARLIDAMITRESAERLIEQVQPFVSIGQISSTLVHELNNRLGSVLNDTNTLKAGNALMEKEPDRAIQYRVRREIHECIHSLERNGEALKNITGLYMGLLATGKREPVYINEVIHQAIGVLNSVAEDSRVVILPALEEDLPATLSIRVRLEQSFVNVILNAVQQIGLGRSWREVLVRSRFVKENSRFPIQVWFTDTGPGIHGKHLEHIFELGFSTRPNGHGLGLFTTKRLIESVGGRIHVEQSVMLMGTTFLVELPLIVPSAQGVAG